MRILVGWDNAEEKSLFDIYLNVDANEATVLSKRDELLVSAQHCDFDVVLLALTVLPTVDETFALFRQLQELQPHAPMVLGCRSTEMLVLPRFLQHGLRSFIVRDAGGDFVFLALAALESAVQAFRAEEARKLTERLREEMDGVRKLQESIIPRDFSVPAGYCLAARYEPSQVTMVGESPVVMAGGDYYDVLRPDDRTLVLLIGDASGHGLKACMSIMAMHTLVRMMFGERFRNTASFVGEINQRLCENSIVQSEGGFITLFYAAIDTVTHTMTWTSAGHPLAQLHDLATNVIAPIGTDEEFGLPLGVVPGAVYAAGKTALPPGSRLLLYSDGLTDAFAQHQPELKAFGVEGLAQALVDKSKVPVEEALAHLFKASHAFTCGSGRHDDTSVLLLERL
jgi:serine phosphatase RsbU (regulator of sigma subunit)